MGGDPREGRRDRAGACTGALFMSVRFLLIARGGGSAGGRLFLCGISLTDPPPAEATQNNSYPLSYCKEKPPPVTLSAF